jgi:hypothetical protein
VQPAPGRHLAVPVRAAPGVSRLAAADTLDRGHPAGPGGGRPRRRRAAGAAGALGTGRPAPARRDPSRTPSGPLSLLPGAAIGLGLEAQRRCLDGAAGLGARLGSVASVAAHPVVTHGPLPAVWRRLDLPGWSRRGLVEQRRNRLAAAAFLRALLAELVTAVLDEVDVDAVVARVDLEPVVERLHLDAIVRRVDVDAIVRASTRPG